MTVAMKALGKARLVRIEVGAPIGLVQLCVIFWLLNGVCAMALENHWVATWSSGQQLVEQANLPPAPGLTGNTLRQVVHVSLGGTHLRLRFSNAYGTNAVELVSIHAALSTGGSAIRTNTDTVVKFMGRVSTRLMPGQVLSSDPLEFQLPALAMLTVSIRFGQIGPAITGHPGSRTTSYLQAGDNVSVESFTEGVTTPHWYFLAGADVVAPAEAATVVALGDSITDGRGSTTDANNRWTDILAARLTTNASTSQVGIVNQGIGGNAVLAGGLGPTALKRFERDVLEQPGAHWLILLEGVNDIGRSTDASVVTNLISAYRQFADWAHARGLRAYSVTILPFGGSMYFNQLHEQARQGLNSWIRNNRDFDAVIDLDAVVRDPAEPVRLRKEFDTGDHLHLNPAGYQKMAEGIDLSLFTH